MKKETAMLVNFRNLEKNGRKYALGCLVLGLLLRLVGLGARPLWFDEVISAVYARQDLAGLLELNAGDNHPPGYYLALKGWIMLFGSSDATLRLFSVLPGLAAIWLVWLVGQKLFPQRPAIALAATALTALSPFQIYFSQEVRNYSTLLCLALLAYYCGLRAFESNRWPDWLGLAIAGTLGLYCNFTMAFYLAALGLYPFFRFRANLARGVLPRLLLAGAATGLASGALLLPKLTGRLDTIKGNFWIPAPDPLIVLRTFYTFLFGAIEAERFVAAFALALIIFLVVVFQAGAALRRPKAEPGLALAAWLLAGPMLLISLVSYLFQPLYLDKALIACAPFYYLLVAWALFRTDRKKPGGWLPVALPLGLALLLALAALPGLYSGTINPLYIARYDAPRVNRYLQEQAQPGDSVVSVTDISWLPLVYYNPGLPPAKYPLKEYPYPNIFPALISRLGSEWLPESALAGRAGRFWAVFEINRPEGELSAPPQPANLSDEPAWLHSPDWQRATLARYEAHFKRLNAVTLDRFMLVLYATAG